VSALPPEIPNVTIRNFCIAVRRWLQRDGTHTHLERTLLTQTLTRRGGGGREAQLVNNVEQYYLDLSAASAGDDGGPLLWAPGFFPRHALALTDFTAHGWQGVLNKMWANETFAKAYQVFLGAPGMALSVRSVTLRAP
jgi:hypothetical protein